MSVPRTIPGDDPEAAQHALSRLPVGSIIGVRVGTPDGIAYLGDDGPDTSRELVDAHPGDDFVVFREGWPNPVPVDHEYRPSWTLMDWSNADTHRMRCGCAIDILMATRVDADENLVPSVAATRMNTPCPLHGGPR